ncbi:MAG: 50S ribosomal protein L35 [Deltaproteobacteria bacterium]|nr:MAG: 50S ribosomal protein L35 [Deltaproteobacteria bacterium]
MPKMKTNRAAAKRFKFTAKGKVKHRKAFRSHILTKKDTKRKRQLRKDGLVDSTNVRQVKRLCPYL